MLASTAERVPGTGGHRGPEPTAAVPSGQQLPSPAWSQAMAAAARHAEPLRPCRQPAGPRLPPAALPWGVRAGPCSAPTKLRRGRCFSKGDGHVGAEGWLPGAPGCPSAEQHHPWVSVRRAAPPPSARPLRGADLRCLLASSLAAAGRRRPRSLGWAAVRWGTGLSFHSALKHLDLRSHVWPVATAWDKADPGGATENAAGR